MLGDCPKERRRDGRGGGKKLRSRPGAIDRFVYRLAAHFRIANVEEWKRTVSLRQVQKWIAFYKIEPFGDDWNRTARSTLFILKAMGSSVDDRFLEMFLPTYDPDRPMTPDEIEAELTKFARKR
jgi:hypothetical protein